MDVFLSPASFAQQRLWFLDRFDPGSPAYHIPVAVRLRGALDRAAVRAAFGQLVERHEALRTTFAVEGGEVLQAVHPALALKMEEEAVAPEALQARILQEVRRPFDLVRGPLLRLRLLRLADDDHVLVVTLHHIVTDGWSMNVLIREFSEAYRAAAEGKSPRFAELPIQYADYAAWQRESLSGEALERQLAYWKNRLAGVPTLELPLDFPRPPEAGLEGKTVSITGADGFLPQLRRIAREEQATLFMVLLAAFQVLLARLGRHPEVVVGTPVANRQRAEIDGLIGMFVNTLALRQEVPDQLSFRALLRQVRQASLDAYAHQDLPFEHLVDALDVARDRSRTPLFQSVFVLENAGRPELALPGVTAEILDLTTDTAKFDLTLTVEEQSEALKCRWEYRTDLFAPETVERFSAHYLRLLESIAAAPDTAVGKLNLLSAAERLHLTTGCNADRIESAMGENLVSWFQATARERGEAVAAVFENQSLSYRELDRRSNGIAAELISRGVVAGDLIGLCVERSLDLVAGILGILKAGGAYLPLDPGYPQDRLRFMLEDSRAKIVVAQSTAWEKLGLDGAILKLEEIASTDQSPAVSIDPSQAAYVIYTSGSTGKPKGVVVTHHNVIRLMRRTEGWYDFSPGDVWTLFHSYAFDFSVWELWGALLYGGRLVVVPYWVSRSPEAFHDLLQKEGVTVLNQTPSAFRSLVAVDRERPQRTLSLRYVIFGGEALELSSLAPWIERHGDQRPQLINMYGITETTVHVTYRRILKDDLLAKRGSVIGKPIPDLSLYVVDAHLEPVPVGVPGELLVGGAGLAHGYLNRPELTAERFVAHPFGSGQVYRTGDLARRLNNGDLEYLGRIDQQVKIRGFRIELGEIEAVLQSHPQVTQAVVIARTEQGSARLAAYLVSREAVPTAELRAWASARLPDYMVPASFARLERIPLTPNGKLDLAALPKGETPAEPDQERVAPATPEEIALAAIWKEVLGIEEVGATDNFFTLGGDSILTLQVISRAAKAGYKVTPKQLFEFQTVAELACAMTRRDENAPSPAAAPRNRHEALLRDHPGVTRVSPLSPMQAGMLFQSLYAPEEGLYFEQVTGEIEGPLNPEAFRAAWQSVADRHEVLRTSFLWRDADEPVQLVHATARVPFEVVAAPASPEAFEALLSADRARGFAFDRAPLMRVTLIRRSETTWTWIWSHHHLLLDGWSLPRVFKEILHFYRVHSGTPAPALPQPRPYGDYIDWLSAQDASAAESFWKKTLQGFETPTVLRVAAPGWKEGDAVHAEAEIRVDPTGTEALKQWARERKLTLNTLFQGAWAILLSRYSGERDILFGVTVSGRPAELEGAGDMVGLFINTLPLRVAVADGRPLAEWLAGIQLHQVEMRGHETTRLVDIQAWSGLPRGQSLFESIFVFENYPVEAGLGGDPADLPIRNIRFLERTNYPITAAVIPGEAMTLKINYDARRFDEATIRNLLAHWRFLLESMVAEPDRVAGRIGLVSHGEQAELSRQSQAPRDFGADAFVHDLFAERAAETPGAVAVFNRQESLDYRTLDEKATRLAGALQRRGVGPEVRVAIYLEKSPALIVSILAVLKAGGAYVPLDPNHGGTRLASILEDSAPRLILTSRNLEGGLPKTAVPALRVEEIAEEGAWQRPELAPDHLAYVIYTSGSTGKPKGVLVPHRGIVNLVRAQAEAFGIAPGRRVLQFASVGFDAAVSEIFMALGTGAALAVEEAEGNVGRLLADLRIDKATLPPALLPTLDPESLAGLRTIVLAGEAASPEVYARWSRGRTLFNAYGPTEGTVCATLERVEPGHPGPVTLGTPMANVEVWIVDDALRPLPAGIAGEIVLGGPGLARGYAGLPGLTAEKFVPHPFSPVGGARLYRTGDLGRRGRDGRIEFLGRTDHQLKIRGFRVEPGEVEAVLAAHPQVESCLVLARRGIGAASQLAAYAVAASPVDEAALRSHMEERLPAYLVPSTFILLPSWPLTPNGKIDRHALLAMEIGSAGADDFLAPRSETEHLLCRIWTEVLRAERVGIRDNFFALGGDSILSLQIIGKAHQAGLEITPKQLFRYPTIEQLAPHVGRSAARPRAQAQPVAGPVPLTPIEHWFFEQDQPEPHHWNQSLLLEVTRPVSREFLEQAVTALTHHHDGLRLRFQKEGSAWRQAYAPASEGETMAYHDWTGKEEWQGALEEECDRLQRGLDLAKGPLFRAAYFHFGGQRTDRLFLVIHHLVIDGVSWRVLAEDFDQILTDLEAGRAPAASLPHKTTSYQEWSVFLSGYAATPALLEEENFWRRPHAPFALPVDRHAAGPYRVADAATASATLSESETESLLRDAPRAYGTQVNDLLLAALSEAMHAETGQGSATIHLEGHGREDLDPGIDLSRTVGWFTTQYPVTLLRDREAPGDRLKSVKEQLRAIPQRGIGYGVLRYLGAPEVRQRLAAAPAPLVSFNYLGQTDQTLGREARFAMAREKTGQSHSRQGHRCHLLDITGIVVEGRLRLDWIYDTGAFDRATVERLARRFNKALRALIAHCLSPEAGGQTPSDFAKVSLNEDELASILEELE